MLADVVAACAAIGDVRVITAGGGQGPAVASALAELEPGPVLVVNADLPCATAPDLEALFAATPTGGVALVETKDGTTNALSLSGPESFSPLYGAGRADRVPAHLVALRLQCVTVQLANLIDDVYPFSDVEHM